MLLRAFLFAVLVAHAMANTCSDYTDPVNLQGEVTFKLSKALGKLDDPVIVQDAVNGFERWAMCGVIPRDRVQYWAQGILAAAKKFDIKVSQDATIQIAAKKGPEAFFKVVKDRKNVY